LVCIHFRNGCKSVQQLIDYEKNKGMQWITVKCDDGGSFFSQLTSNLATRTHNAGLYIESPWK